MDLVYKGRFLASGVFNALRRGATAAGHIINSETTIKQSSISLKLKQRQEKRDKVDAAGDSN